MLILHGSNHRLRKPLTLIGGSTTDDSYYSWHFVSIVDLKLADQQSQFCAKGEHTAYVVPRTVRWSRREDLNTPSAENNSAALQLSYTGELIKFSEDHLTKIK